MGSPESLSLVAAFILGVIFTLAASFRPAHARAEHGQLLESQGEPVIGPPPGWKP